ncbi:hypothetical protein E4U61_005403 [Claviceps capensis]|nr:hypothetical protein E4U61_005403 [Claviceps capensis]
MMGVDDTIRLDSLDEAEDALPSVDDFSDSNEPQSLDIRPNKPTKKAAPARTTTPKLYRFVKAIPKKTPSRATPRTAPIVSNTMANASHPHPHPHPEMQDLMVAISDVTSYDYDFSLCLTTAILRWLQKDPNLNSVTWIAFQNSKTKLYFLALEPGFEDAEFPFDLDRQHIDAAKKLCRNEIIYQSETVDAEPYNAAVNPRQCYRCYKFGHLTAHCEALRDVDDVRPKITTVATTTVRYAKR